MLDQTMKNQISINRWIKRFLIFFLNKTQINIKRSNALKAEPP